MLFFNIYNFFGVCCRKEKIIFPLPFWVLSWNPCKKKKKKGHTKKRKQTNKLLACTTHIDMGDTQKRWTTQRSGWEVSLKNHLYREKGEGI